MAPSVKRPTERSTFYLSDWRDGRILRRVTLAKLATYAHEAVEFLSTQKLRGR